MARADRIRLASAQISGLAMACVQVGRITEDETQTAIRAVVAKLPVPDRQQALDHAAALYVRPGPNDVFYAQLAALLERAGADLDTARTIRDAHGPYRYI